MRNAARSSGCFYSILLYTFPWRGSRDAALDFAIPSRGCRIRSARMRRSHSYLASEPASNRAIRIPSCKTPSMIWRMIARKVSFTFLEVLVRQGFNVLSPNRAKRCWHDCCSRVAVDAMQAQAKCVGPEARLRCNLEKVKEVIALGFSFLRK